MVDVGTAAQEAQSENDIAGGRPEPGRYHVQILDADETCDKYDAILIQFEILAGNRDGQEKKTITEKFWLSEKARDRLHRLLLCLKIRPVGVVDMALTVGRQMIIEIEAKPYVDKTTGEDKVGIQVSYMGLWSVGNAEVADVPKNAEAHATWMAFTSTAPPALAPQQQQQPQQVVAPAPVAPVQQQQVPPAPQQQPPPAAAPPVQAAPDPYANL